MPTKRRPATWRKFLRDWGLFLGIGLALVVGAVLLGTLSGRQREVAGDRPYRLYFTQNDIGTPAPNGLEAEILKDIEWAQRSIDVATPALDLPRLAQGLARARARGVLVRVLENPPAAEDSAVISVTTFLQNAGVPVTLHPSEGALGGTFLVVDERVVWVGSWILLQQVLAEDAIYVLRWDLPPLAQDFHREFSEMVEEGAYGPTSPQDTRARFIAVLGTTLDVYMTPEDDPLADILQRMASARTEIALLTEVLDDSRIEERLLAQAPLTTLQIWGLVSRAQEPTENLGELLRRGAQILPYGGPGKMRENAILLDGRVTVILSQRLVGDRLDRYDGYVLVVDDTDLTALIGLEYKRLYGLSQPVPQPQPTPAR